MTLGVLAFIEAFRAQYEDWLMDKILNACRFLESEQTREDSFNP